MIPAEVSRNARLPMSDEHSTISFCDILHLCNYYRSTRAVQLAVYVLRSILPITYILHHVTYTLIFSRKYTREGAEHCSPQCPKPIFKDVLEAFVDVVLHYAGQLQHHGIKPAFDRLLDAVAEGVGVVLVVQHR